MEGGVGRGKQQNGSVISRGTLGELVPHDQCLYAKEAFTREHWTLNLESGRMRAVKTVTDGEAVLRLGEAVWPIGRQF